MKDKECDNQTFLFLVKIVCLGFEKSPTSWAEVVSFLMKINVLILLKKYHFIILSTLKSLTQKGRNEHPRQQQQQRVNQTHPGKKKSEEKKISTLLFQPIVFVEVDTVDQTLASHVGQGNTAGPTTSPH